MTKEEELLAEIQKQVKEYEQLKKEKEKKKQEKQKEKEKVSQLATKEDLKELMNKLNQGKTGTDVLQPQTMQQSVPQPVPPQTQQQPQTMQQPMQQEPIDQQMQQQQPIQPQQPQKKQLTTRQQIALQIWRDSKATTIICLIAIVFPMMSILIAMIEPQFALIISMVGIIYPCFILVKMISVQTRLHQKYGLRPLLQFRQQQPMYQQIPQQQPLQQQKKNEDIML